MAHRPPRHVKKAGVIAKDLCATCGREIPNKDLSDAARRGYCSMECWAVDIRRMEKRKERRRASLARLVI